MTKIMEADFGKAGVHKHCVEIPLHVALIEWIAYGVGEDQVAILPLATRKLLLDDLVLPMRRQHLHQIWANVDGSAAVPGLSYQVKIEFVLGNPQQTNGRCGLMATRHY